MNKIDSQSTGKLLLQGEVTVAVTDNEGKALILAELSPHLVDAIEYTAAVLTGEDLAKLFQDRLDLSESDAKFHSKLMIQFIDKMSQLYASELLTRESDKLMEDV